MFKNSKQIVLMAFFIIFIFGLCTVFAHPGRTDADGGHYNHSTGEYHYHTGEYAGRYNYSTGDYHEGIHTEADDDSEETSIGEIVFNVIMSILVVGFHFVLPIIYAIKESIYTNNDGVKRLDIKDFLRNIFYALLIPMIAVLCVVITILLD